jgi:hypothetical protein
MSQKFWSLLLIWMAGLHEATHIEQPVHLLADCVLRISIQYFSTGRTVVFSSTFNNENRMHQGTETMVGIEDIVTEA